MQIVREVVDARLHGLELVGHHLEQLGRARRQMQQVVLLHEHADFGAVAAALTASTSIRSRAVIAAAAAASVHLQHLVGQEAAHTYITNRSSVHHYIQYNIQYNICKYGYTKAVYSYCALLFENGYTRNEVRTDS